MRVRAVLVIAAAALAGCGGGALPGSPDGAVKKWADAINARDWKQACEISADPGSSCESKLRDNVREDRVTFDGPASNGNPGDRAFSLSAGRRRTLMVAAVPRGGGYVVRFEAIIER